MTLTRSKAAPWLQSYGRESCDVHIRVTAKSEKLQGNRRPYFSVTGEIYCKRHRHSDVFACGCLHDEILQAWPELAPLVALHLAWSDTGEPLHAEENGFYWFAGWKGGLGQTYHGGNSTPAKSPEECLSILADHVRLPVSTVREQLADTTTRASFNEWIKEQRPRWSEEAEAGLGMLGAA